MQRTQMTIQHRRAITRFFQGIGTSLLAVFMALGLCWIPIIGWVLSPLLLIAAVGLPLAFLVNPRWSDRLSGSCPHCQLPIANLQRWNKKRLPCPHCTSPIAIGEGEFLAVGEVRG